MERRVRGGVLGERDKSKTPRSIFTERRYSEVLRGTGNQSRKTFTFVS